MSDRFYIALLPPEEIQAQVRSIQQEFVDRYNSRAALKSPPHITLQPPFECLEQDLPRLIATLERFAGGQIPVPVTLSGFNCFAPRAIYVEVRNSPELLGMKQGVGSDLAAARLIQAAETRPFVPHITVGFRDLTPEDFQIAWADFQTRTFTATFTVPRLTLLRHVEQHWQVDTEFGLAGIGTNADIETDIETDGATKSSPAHRPET